MTLYGPNSGFYDAGARQAPGEDTRFGGIYEGKYLDTDQEKAWDEAQKKQAEFFVYVELFNSKYLGTPDYDFQIAWALRILARANQEISCAVDESQKMTIRRGLDDARERNIKQFEKAEAFIAEQDIIAAKELVSTMSDATNALIIGSLEKYRQAEARLHHTDKITTQAGRDRLQADQYYRDED